jgi:hypothetical protein
MEFIPLRDRKGRIIAHASVDAEDYEWLKQWRWSFNSIYAARMVNRKIIFMHHLIVGQPFSPRLHTDHVNREPLDNRRSNLRIIPVSQNMRNSKVRADNTSGFKGVIWDKARGCWVAQTSMDGRRIYLGGHATAEAANLVVRRYCEPLEA